MTKKQLAIEILTKAKEIDIAYQRAEEAGITLGSIQEIPFELTDLVLTVLGFPETKPGVFDREAYEFDVTDSLSLNETIESYVDRALSDLKLLKADAPDLFV